MRATAADAGGAPAAAIVLHDCQGGGWPSVPLLGLQALGLWEAGSERLPELSPAVARSLAESKWPVSLAGASTQAIGKPMKEVTKDVLKMLSHVADGKGTVLPPKPAEQKCFGLCQCRESGPARRLQPFFLKTFEGVLRRLRLPSILMKCTSTAAQGDLLDERFFYVIAWCPQVLMGP